MRPILKGLLSLQIYDQIYDQVCNQLCPCLSLFYIMEILPDYTGFDRKFLKLSRDGSAQFISCHYLKKSNTSCGGFKSQVHAQLKAAQNFEHVQIYGQANDQIYDQIYGQADDQIYDQIYGQADDQIYDQVCPSKVEIEWQTYNF